MGGLAVGVRAQIRFTQDVDLAVSVAGDEAADAIGGLFLGRGYKPIGQLIQDDTGRFATLRLQPPPPRGVELRTSAPPILDVLFASSGVEPEAVAGSTPAEVVPGLTVRTARIPHLIAMKLLSEAEHRLKDRSDLQTLIASATRADLEEVPPLLGLIRSRGSERGKDLPALFARYLELDAKPPDTPLRDTRPPI